MWLGAVDLEVFILDALLDVVVSFVGCIIFFIHTESLFFLPWKECVLVLCVV